MMRQTGREHGRKKGRKHRKEEQGGRRNLPGQGNSQQGEHEEQMAAAEVEELQEVALQKPWRQHAQFVQRSDDMSWRETENGLKDLALEGDLGRRG